MKHTPCGAISCHLQYEWMFGSTQVSNPLLAHHVIWMGGNLLIFALTKSEHLITWYVLWGQEYYHLYHQGKRRLQALGRSLKNCVQKKLSLS